MKKIRSEFLPLVLVVIVLLSHVACMAASSFCFGPHEHDMATRGVEQWIGKLGSALHKNLPSISSTRRTSWLQIAEIEDRRLQASADVVRSMGKAEEAAKLAGGVGLGAKTADRYAEILGSPSALESAGDLDKAGSGLGHLSAGKPDDYTDKFLQRQTATVNSQPNGKPSLASRGYSEVEMLNDVDYLFKNPPPGYSRLLNRIQESNDPTDFGSLSELRSSASLRRRGEVLEAVDADKVAGPLKDKKVDILTDKAAYQNVLSANTFDGKVKEPGDADKLADAIIAVEVEVAPRKFQFCGSDLVPHQASIDEVNAALERKLEGSGKIRKFEASDFHLLPWDQ